MHDNLYILTFFDVINVIKLSKKKREQASCEYLILKNAFSV